MKIAFLDCIFDMPARQLWRNGKALALEPKMYEFLEILIQKRPAVVTNEELDELLWPKVYVARSSLTRIVSELRSALGDTPQDPKIIRTVYKKGYAFCATVKGSPPAGSRSVFSLVWKQQVTALSDGEHIAGRGIDCSVVIDATSVSRRHARIVIGNGAATIEDLASTNGTQVNGVSANMPTPLANGCRISLGDEELTFRSYDPSALTIRSGSTQSGPRVADKQ